MYTRTCSKKNVHKLPFCCLRPRYENSLHVSGESFNGEQIKFLKKIHISERWRYHFWQVENYGKTSDLWKEFRWFFLMEKNLSGKQKNFKLNQKKCTEEQKNRKSSKVSGKIEPDCKELVPSKSGPFFRGGATNMYFRRGLWICNTKSAWISETMENEKNWSDYILFQLFCTETKTS